MDLKQLRAFLSVVETGSVTRAAELLHIVQPAVSRQIRLLEEDFGTPLFRRGRNGMEPTEAGVILVDRARRVLRELEQARDEIRPVSGALTGLVSLGLLPSTSDLLAAPIVRRLRELHPELQVNVAVGYAGHMQQWLENGDVDVALLYDVKPSSARTAHMLLEERLYLVGPPCAGLRADRPIPLREAAALPLILPTPPHGLRVLFEHACAKAEIHPVISAQTNAMGVQKSLVMDEQGFTILPSAAIFDDIVGNRLSAAPIVEPDLSRKIILARRTDRRPSPQVHALSDALCALVRQTVTSGSWPDARWLADEPT